MRLLKALFVLFLFSSAFGQENEWRMMGQLEDHSAAIFLHCGPWERTHQYVLTWTNGSAQDTLIFEPNGQHLYTGDTFLLKAVQVDGWGQKEIVISWLDKSGLASYVKEESITDYHNRIWNLDTRRELFAVVDRHSHEHSTNDGTSETLWEKSHYSYRFSIDSAGTIRLSDFESQYENRAYTKLPNGKRKLTETSGELEPVMKVGIYRFKDGEYVWEEL